MQLSRATKTRKHKKLHHKNTDAEAAKNREENNYC